jgi:hypothetical protein
MSDDLDGIPELIEIGEQFTYENFSNKNSRGYPVAHSANWLVWIDRVAQLAGQLPDKSPITKSIVSGIGTRLLGEGSEDFDRAKAQILNGLHAAQVRQTSNSIPASDRVVTLGDNSPDQQTTLAKIDELITAVESANDFPGSPEDKEVTIAELSAARKLFEFAKVRAGAAKAALQPRLRWLMEKGATALVGILAKALWDHLTGLKLF